MIKKGILYEKYKLTYHQEEKNKGEVWKKIPSDLIDGLKQCLISSHGRVKNSKGRITCGYLHTNGYIKVHLSKKTYSLHRLLAKIFISNLENKEQVNHKDGDKQNNSIDNLEWTTASEKCVHRSNEIHSIYLKKYINMI